ncbi:MAG: PilZ domain-containing protein [Bryobacteraceae bacterium]
MQTNTHAGDIATSPANRRSEPRRLATGTVQLKFEGVAGSEVELDLMDVSASGFRVCHAYGPLALGAKAAFRHADAAGKARVVWNWLSPDHMETGFVVFR